jgi:tetratricopeptide (TPR) repeat protein
MTALAGMRAALSKTRAATVKEEAALAREQGAFAFLDNADEAIRHYAEACELDPDNAEGWNRLAALKLQAGDLDGAQRCLERAMAAEASSTAQAALAHAARNLGKIHLVQGRLDEAEAINEKALALCSAMDHKEGMADAYGTFGKLAEERRDKASACAMWAKALDLFRQVGTRAQIEEVEGWMRKAGCAE